MGYMNQPKFMELYAYALQSDFQSPDSEPAAWAPGHPFHWDQELDKIILGGVGSSLSLSPDDQFLAVGVGQNIHVYSTFTREYVETLTGHLDEGSIAVWEFDRDGRNVSAEEENRVDIDILSAKAADTAISKLVSDHGWTLDEDGAKAIAGGFKTIITKAVDIHALEKQITLDGKFASYGAPFSPDGQKMVYVTQNSTTRNGMRDAETLPRVHMWDVEAKENQHRLLGHTDTKQQFARRPGCQLERGSASKPVCTADSSLLVVSDADGAVRFWRLCERVCIYI